MNLWTLKLISRYALMAILIFISFFSFSKALYYTSFSSGLFTLICLLEYYFFIKKREQKIILFIESLIHEDYQYTVNIHKQDNNILKKLAELQHIQKQQRHTYQEKEYIYENILNSIDSALLILCTSKQTKSVYFMNNAFSKLFNIPKTRSYSTLEQLIPKVLEHVQQRKETQSKLALELQINQQNKQTFLLQTNTTLNQGKKFEIILLDPIQNVLDKKQNEDWGNLMKIISHELMNSLTPIHSLANNAQSILGQESWNTEDIEDLQLSMHTIVNRTHHLSRFIDNYRKLTMLGSPHKETVSLETFSKQCRDIILPLTQQYDIDLRVSCQINMEVLWDISQMQQVVINLLHNAITATKNISEQRQINLSIYIKESRIYVDVKDNGQGVAIEIIDKIWMPFYTTTENGAGIGLSLSKNIIQSHGGYLTYHRKEHWTIFRINLPLTTATHQEPKVNQ